MDIYEVIMNVQKLLSLAGKPELYEPGTAFMWEDEYISSQLLAVHLNQDIDLASRKESTVDLTIDWMLDKVTGENLHILDLGCGPGLYTERLARLGHRVTGMDVSPASVDHARKSAERNNLPIEYRQRNYLELCEKDKYDLIIMIFTDFGVLTPKQQKSLLEKVHRALKSGGSFIFDVLNSNYDLQAAVGNSWELSEKGFWRPDPYLALSESFFFEREGVGLSQHIVVDENADSEVYRFWIHTFSDNALKTGCSSAGFTSIRCFQNVIPDTDSYSSGSVTFCVAGK